MLSLAGIIALQEHPEKMDAGTLDALREVVDMYPSFHAARLLLVMNMLCMGKEYGELQKYVSMFLPCSDEFGQIMDGFLSMRRKGMLAQDRTMNLLNEFLGEGGDESVPSILQQNAVSGDYLSMAGLDDSVDDSVPDESDALPHTPTDNLLDAFLKNAGKSDMGIGIGTMPPSRTADAGMDAAADDPEDENDVQGHPVDEKLFTETLASIYIKQHRYEEAIEIIHSLCLNFPNKSSYFADQIRYLEKILEVNKQKDK